RPKNRLREAAGGFRDKGSNLDLHIQSVASCRLDDPGLHLTSVHPRRGSEVDAAADADTETSVTPASRRTMLSMPLAHSSTLDRRIRRPTWRSIGARRSCVGRKITGKSQSIISASIFRAQAQTDLSLSGGASFSISACSS